MARRILGPTGSRRRRRFLFGPMLLVALLGLLLTAGAQAVHDEGIFQLDGDATTALPSDPPADEDWDLICKAHQPSSTPPGECTFVDHDVPPDGTADEIPPGTTVADPTQFVVDAFGSETDDVFTGGGSKDDLDISSWTFKNAKPSPDKDDIEHAYAAEYECTAAFTNPSCDAIGDKFVYFGADRFSNEGDANIAFWFLQAQVAQDGDGATPELCVSGGGCGFTGTHVEHGPGPDGYICYPGQTGPAILAGGSPPAPNCVTGSPLPGADDTRGDILVVSAFTGGGEQPNITVYEWVGLGNAPTALKVTNDRSVVRIPTPANLADGCLTDGLIEDPACAVVNSGPVDSPWPFTDKAVGATNEFQTSEFFEGGLNLTALGLAETCFSTFLVNTRSSQEVNATLKDFALGELGRCVPTMTTQASTNGTVAPGIPVTDTATITVEGAATSADPTGTVTFFLCGPIATGDCGTSGGVNVGTGTLADASDPADANDGLASATSPTVNDSGQTGNRGPLGPGRYCFRATWPGDQNYVLDSPLNVTNATTECFTVQDVSSVTTEQDWLPNDTATITSDGDTNLNGTVTFTLHESSDCTGPAIYGPEVDTLTNAASPAETASNNETVFVNASKTVSWKVVFASTDGGVQSPAFATCERSTLDIDNAPPGLIVIKNVINDDGGTAAAADFTITVDDPGSNPSSFAGAAAPGTLVVVDAGAYSVSEIGPAGYAETQSSDCSGTIASGQTKTCTITNDDIAPGP
jgi:Prealbumin-like fold domain